MVQYSLVRPNIGIKQQTVLIRDIIMGVKVDLLRKLTGEGGTGDVAVMGVLDGAQKIHFLGRVLIVYTDPGIMWREERRERT